MTRVPLPSAVLVVLCTLAAGHAPAGEELPAPYGVVRFAHNVMIPMRDGVKLATDIYRPATGDTPVTEKLPLLLQRTPYNKESASLVAQAKAFASRGYVVALQDDRGTYASEGVQVKYIGYGKDGFDTVEYLAALPYTDGQVGMWGTSYAAHTQAGAAIAHPPHLKTVVLNCGGLYNGWLYKIRNHGAFELAQQVGWAFSQLAAQTANPEVREVFRREKAVDWVANLHGKRGLTPLALAPNVESYIYDMMTRSDYDDYWQQPDVNWSVAFDETADIPMLHITGWFDSYTMGTIANYVGLAKVKKSPQRLIVGPWTHGANTTSRAGDVEFGPDAAIADFATDFHLRWFDRVLKGQSAPGADEAPVRLFVMGTGDGHRDANGRLFHGGHWMSAESWPPPDAQPRSYFLHEDGTLGAEPADSGVRPTTFTYDPSRPVPTIGGSFSSQRGMVAAGGYDQREREFTGNETKGFYGSRPPYLPLAARPDVIVFQTDPLAEDVEVVGPVEVTLFASSTAVDTDFTAKLVDVYPPSTDYPLGYALNITDGIVRGRYRNSPERQELMTPGQVYQVTIEPFPTANVFKKGHRIRLDISSSNFPRFDVNPNTGEPLGLDRRTVVAENTVYHDARHQSRLVLLVRTAPAAAASPRGLED